MRKFRNSALAIATATTVAFGGMTAASAQEEQAPELSTQIQQSADGSFAGIQEGAATLSADDREGVSLSSKVNNAFDLEGDQELNPRDLFGFETNMDNVPEWAKVFLGVGVAAGIAAFIGLVVAPIYNYIHFG